MSCDLQAHCSNTKDDFTSKNMQVRKLIVYLIIIDKVVHHPSGVFNLAGMEV